MLAKERKPLTNLSKSAGGLILLIATAIGAKLVLTVAAEV